QGPRLLNLAPCALVLVEQIVHFPKPVLQRRRFGSQRCVAPMFMVWKWKVPEDNPQTGAIILLQRTNRSHRRRGARRTLEISEFLERHRRGGFSPHVLRRHCRLAARRGGRSCKSA